MVMEKRGEMEAAEKLRRMNPITCRIHAKMAYELARDLGAPRSVLWPLMMASRNHTPVNWVPAVVHIVRDLGSDEGYEAAAAMLKDILSKPRRKRLLRRQPD